MDIKYIGNVGPASGEGGGSSDGANTSLSNLTDAGKIVAANASMPSDTYEDLTLSASGTEYTAPADGWFALSAYNGGQNYSTRMVCNNVAWSVRTGETGNGFAISCPAAKSQKMKLTYDGFQSVAYFRFIYAQGSESEYTPS